MLSHFSGVFGPAWTAEAGTFSQLCFLINVKGGERGKKRQRRRSTELTQFHRVRDRDKEKTQGWMGMSFEQKWWE